jgi:hypothetical protein
LDLKKGLDASLQSPEGYGLKGQNPPLALAATFLNFILADQKVTAF